MQRFSVKDRQICDLEQISNILVSEINKNNIKDRINCERKAALKYLSKYL